jgi:hypothetical protein
LLPHISLVALVILCTSYMWHFYCQHLLRFRWDELHIEEWRSAISDDADLLAGLYDTTNILPSKSDVAALMTEVLCYVFTCLFYVFLLVV